MTKKLYKERLGKNIKRMSESPRSDDGYQSHYKESYAYQEPKGHDDYGNATYTAYNERYAYQNATGRDTLKIQIEPQNLINYVFL